MPFYYVSGESLTGLGPFVDAAALVEGMQDEIAGVKSAPDEEGGVVLFIDDNGAITQVEDSWDFLGENS